MNSRFQPAWSRDIRRHVIEMLALLVALVILVECFGFWSRKLLEGIERDANSYHLTANTHYLAAMEELRKIHGQAAFLAAGEKESLTEKTGSYQQLQNIQLLTMNHIVQQKILKGLALEESFNDIRFTALRKKLGQQRLALDSSFQKVQKNRRGNIIDGPDIDRILVTLDQMVRLHSAIRDARIEEHRQQRQQLNVIFYILIAALLLIGLIITRRSFAAIGRVMRRQEKTEEKIRHQAHFDALTHLPNRFLALDRLSLMILEARRRENKIAVLFIDLDFFKKVNDMLGHISGDKLLVEAAGRISKSVREADTVGRLGGDEFIVLIGGIESGEEAQAVAENVIASVGKVFHIDGKELMLSASVGISIYPDDGDQTLELIRKADSAMYHSKHSGRNTYSYFTEKMNLSISRHLSLEAQIYGALDRGEFEVVYQQKMDVFSQRIVGAEALLRWHNTELGSVPPDEFIPVAEQTALIIPIGKYVIDDALKMARQWQKLAPQFKVAVNISPRQFRDPGLVDYISQALDEAEVPSQGLELEITEGVLMTEHIEVDRVLAELSQLGVAIAMDDFGTGYSSLNYLRNYPFGVIKIDRSFIHDVDTNSMSAQLINAAISMAHALDIAVVAEGVETAEQFAVLKQHNCDIAQGDYFGKPVSAHVVTGLLESELNAGPPSRKSSSGQQFSLPTGID